MQTEDIRVSTDVEPLYTDECEPNILSLKRPVGPHIVTLYSFKQLESQRSLSNAFLLVLITKH